MQIFEAAASWNTLSNDRLWKGRRSFQDRRLVPQQHKRRPVINRKNRNWHALHLRRVVSSALRTPVIFQSKLQGHITIRLRNQPKRQGAVSTKRWHLRENALPSYYGILTHYINLEKKILIVLVVDRDPFWNSCCKAFHRDKSHAFMLSDNGFWDAKCGAIVDILYYQFETFGKGVIASSICNAAIILRCYRENTDPVFESF